MCIIAWHNGRSGSSACCFWWVLQHRFQPETWEHDNHRSWSSILTAWTPQPYVELIAIYSTLALSLSKQVRVRPFVLRAYNLHCCTAQGMAPNAMEIEHEVAAWRCFFMRACFSSLGVTLVSVPDNSSECEFYLHPSSLFVVVWIAFHLSIVCLQDSTMAPNANRTRSCCTGSSVRTGISIS